METLKTRNPGELEESWLAAGMSLCQQLGLLSSEVQEEEGVILPFLFYTDSLWATSYTGGCLRNSETYIQ